MEPVIEFISSENFKYFAAIAIGGILSWYISKHFFFRKAPSKLHLAKRQRVTDFGNQRNLAYENQEVVIDHEIFGKWTCKSDGTVKDYQNRLMWIRAPWGMTWNGQHFIGEPIKLNWYEATQLFGQGSYIEGSGASLKKSKIQNTYGTKKYKKGSCKVSFAGYDDWRMPSAYELDSLGFYTSEKVNPNYSRSTKDEPNKLREQLFPGLALASNGYWLWCADEAGSNCAWACDGSWPLGDFQFKRKFYVIFVRSL